MSAIEPFLHELRRSCRSLEELNICHLPKKHASVKSAKRRPQARSESRPVLKPSNSFHGLKTFSGLRHDDVAIGELIGEGFYGEVFKYNTKLQGKIIATGEEIVAKRMRLQLGTKPGHASEEKLMEEIRTLRSLEHPNVLKYVDVYRDTGRLYLLAEYVRGGTLDDLINDSNRPFPWHRRLTIAKDVAAGMAYLHQEGIIHRDLNPNNILIKPPKPDQPDPVAVLADFGLVLYVDQEHRRDKAGSAYWMAPEMLEGRPTYDARVDVFSFGVTLFGIVARISADPEEGIPRRHHDYGIDLKVGGTFRRRCAEAPLIFVLIAAHCSNVDPELRPTSDKVLEWLSDVYTGYKLSLTRCFDSHFVGVDAKHRRKSCPGGGPGDLGKGTSKDRSGSCFLLPYELCTSTAAARESNDSGIDSGTGPETADGLVMMDFAARRHLRNGALSADNDPVVITPPKPASLAKDSSSNSNSSCLMPNSAFESPLVVETTDTCSAGGGVVRSADRPPHVSKTVTWSSNGGLGLTEPPPSMVVVSHSRSGSCPNPDSDLCQPEVPPPIRAEILSDPFLRLYSSNIPTTVLRKRAATLERQLMIDGVVECLSNCD